MTPEPEPDPDPPVPTTRTIHVKGTTTLNNSHMFRLMNLDGYFVFTGGVVVINQYTDFDITIPLNTSVMLMVKSKGYNNSYPDYTDSYYDDGTYLKFSGVQYIVIAADRADGSTLTVTQTDGTTGTFSWS